ncbi:MAG: ABC transporter ATP-binding protein, partial [Thermodesulfobacteriota bacterium]
MLKVENLIKDYTTGFLKKKVRVLKSVSFSVNQGEIFGFVGPNGAGKTTTFKIILGFVPLTDGKVELMEKPVGDEDVKKHIGYLPENPYFYDYLTGEELLRYMGELHGFNGKGLATRIDELLDKVNMSHARKVQLRKYSKGMLQRVGIAQALINDPDFLILDEPMSGLDPIGQREIKELILEEKKKGKTILLSSHMLSDVEALCDRVGVIMDGRIVKTGELGKLFEEIHTDYEMLLKGVDERVMSNLSDLKITVEKR